MGETRRFDPYQSKKPRPYIKGKAQPYTPNSGSLERAWSRGIVCRTKEYSFVLSTMPRLHARSRLLELGVYTNEFATALA